jgi:hypothetical protein
LGKRAKSPLDELGRNTLKECDPVTTEELVPRATNPINQQGHFSANKLIIIIIIHDHHSFI